MTAVPPPGAHGGDGARLAAALGLDPGGVLDLSASLNPVAPDVASLAAHRLGELRRYPDPRAATAALAGAVGVDADGVLLTNGGAEAIALVAAEMGGSVSEPEFSLHPRGGGPRWRSNPHNPTGRLAGPAERAAVWDEAFYPLASGRWTRGDEGSVVVGSLTKLFACPGLRLGYVLADPAVVAAVAARQPQWSVGGLAAAVGVDLLERADLPRYRREIAALRADLVALLSSHDLDPQPSDANFVLCSAAAGLRERLAPHGVLVRDCTSFGLPGAARLAVPGAAGLERLAAALDRSAGSRPPAAGAGVAFDRGAALPPPGAGDPAGPRPRAAAPLRGALMVCATSSDAGKSAVVTGLCRLLARQGVRVAPFKAQNMALNSYATASGHEIGRAQAAQALAAGVEPEVAMNPVLLKPISTRTSQVVVLGRPVGHLSAAEYHRRKPELLGVVTGALADLRARFDVVIIEGAGSPAEINLLDHDIVNLRLAQRAGVPAVLVGDIDRGGVWAALYGTVALLPDPYRRLVRGFVVNKFRGDPALLGDGLARLEERCGVPALGVLPWLRDVGLDAEDSLALAAVDRIPAGDTATLDVAVIAFPTIANFTDLDALAVEADVGVRMVGSPGSLGDPDLVVLPGSKATVADLGWLRRRRLDAAVAAARRRGSLVVGVCGGYQMLGRVIRDEVESGAGTVAGLGWLDAATTFHPVKITRQRRGRALGQAVAGYEIRHGRTTPGPGSVPWIDLDPPAGTRTSRTGGDDSAGGGDRRGGPESASSPDGAVLGTTLHGLWDSDGFRSAFLDHVAARRGKRFVPAGVSFAGARLSQWDRLADAIEAHLDTAALRSLVASAEPPAPAGRTTGRRPATGGPAPAGPPAPTPAPPAASPDPGAAP